MNCLNCGDAMAVVTKENKEIYSCFNCGSEESKED